MAQHKCGTCLHFEEGGIAGTGWCRHPLRQDIQNVVLVRRNELACRDGWSGDLWESRTGETTIVTPAPPAIANHANGAKAPTMTNQHTDQVTTIGISPGRPKVPEPAMPDRVPPAVPAAVGSSNGTGEQRLSRLDPAPELSTSEEESKSKLVETGARIAHGSGSLGSANRIPATAPRSSPLRSDAAPPRMRLSLDGPPSEPRSPREPIDTPREAWSEPRFGARPEPWSAASFSVGRSRSGETEPFPVARPPLSAPSPRRMPQPPAHYSADGQPKPVEAPPHDQPREPETARSSAPAPRAHPPISTRIAQISHCCMTCRDFRPVNGGERGRCENHFAFEEPREVSRDGIACQSTIGDWWTAADDWWLQQADISHHGRPTPQFNELLHELLLRRRDGRT